LPPAVDQQGAASPVQQVVDIGFEGDRALRQEIADATLHRSVDREPSREIVPVRVERPIPKVDIRQEVGALPHDAGHEVAQGKVAVFPGQKLDAGFLSAGVCEDALRHGEP
jgi:hypothetical protein